MRTCAVTDCGFPVDARGYCTKHYERVRRHGHPRALGIDPRLSLARRWWAKVEVGPDCWEWRATKKPNGYGYLFNKGKHVYAYRFAYELLVGPIPAGLLVCHHCDNPGCVNPNHLFVGTTKDNSVDAVRKGRRPSGTANPMAVLTPEKAGEIRHLLQGGMPVLAVARMYDVSEGCVAKIRRGETWRNAPAPLADALDAGRGDG